MHKWRTLLYLYSRSLAISEKSFHRENLFLYGEENFSFSFAIFPSFFIQSRDFSIGLFLFSIILMFTIICFHRLLFTARFFLISIGQFAFDFNLLSFLSRLATIKFLVTIIFFSCAARDLLQIEHALERFIDKSLRKTYMKNGDGHWEVRSTSDIEAESITDAMEQFKILRASIRDADCRGLFFNFKRDLRHFCELLFSIFDCTIISLHFFYFLLSLKLFSSNESKAFDFAPTNWKSAN